MSTEPKALSKEEILAKQYGWTELEFNYHTSVSKDISLRAMDTYAKQECIAFAEWVKDNHYTKNLNNEDVRWYKYFEVREDFPAGFTMSSGVSEYFTSEQLYNKFIEHQTSLK